MAYNRALFQMSYGFSEGFALAYNGDLYGFIGADGDWVIPPPTNLIGDDRNYQAFSFSEGLARIYYHSTRTYGFIDKKGNIVIEPVWAEAENFSNGLALVAKYIDGCPVYGFINASGDIVIEPELKSANSFSEGLALVHHSDGGFGFIDTEGNMVIDLVEIFGDSVRASNYMTEGHVLVKSNDQLYILNSEGEIVF